MTPPVFCLSIHADYACGHAGRCCATPWDVPVEARPMAVLRGALASGRLQADEPFIALDDPPEGAVAVLRRDAGGCVFFERGTRLCAVHRAAG